MQPQEKSQEDSQRSIKEDSRKRCNICKDIINEGQAYFTIDTRPDGTVYFCKDCAEWEVKYN